ncbi:lytic murein transglycosylase B [Roseateles koreensis]|uniref:Lytic murein transglycosylase B n=1 Tax=Roseateles koreensis TaxID=2987526 RepID=A0ABT5KVL9_9BURK|nr:lytic murein transglycosylase B [Roseateles koreensis]MDC8786986.1 lytic murein transglycosylase B [Roseateles koreensis]
MDKFAQMPLLTPPARRTAPQLFQDLAHGLTQMATLTSLIAALMGGGFAAEAAGATAKAHKAAKNKSVKKVHDKAPQAFGERADLMQFADEFAAQQQWDEASRLRLREQLAQARSTPIVQRLIMPAAAGQAKDWQAYRARFVEPRRLQAGLKFWEQNADALARAEARFGVPAELIAGLIGVETFYGQITGGFRVIDALATLSFDFPTGRSDRSPFFRNELAEFFKLCHREALNPAEIKGSFAGAMGWPQFMPGSWNRYAIDFDGDGRVDLIHNPADAIGSVANYLAQQGWLPGLPTHFSLRMPADTQARAALLTPDIKPSFSIPQLQALGAVPSEAALDHPGPLAVIELQNGTAAPSYWLGTDNFYALTRYNWSSYYAFAVIDLGRALAELRKAAQQSAPAR